ncbi:hypothetical protein ACGYLO_18595 [Sulfitobacter sp. 1A13353]|uniref:hypothetical protein n=1 Tax=Sulfitobacter sp. 1A13353 TaxID=3368568 RepID=UPI0037454A2F
MTIKTSANGLVMLTACLAVSACSMEGSSFDQVDANTDRGLARADGAMDSFTNSPSVRGGGAQVSDGVFVAPLKERSNASALLPAHVQTPNAVVMSSRDPLSLVQVAERLTSITGIEHIASLGPSAEDGVNISKGNGNRMLRPNYSGKLSEVLGEVSTSFGVEWSYSDGKIIFRDYVTRQYQIPVIPSTTSGGSSVGSASSGYSTDFWGEFEESVKGILGDDVVYNISRSSGLLSVTAKVDSHADIRAYVDEISKNMTQQIAFDVNVLSVVSKETNGAGFDLDLAIKEGTKSFGALTTARGSGDSTGGMNLSIVDGPVEFKAFMEAISTQGKATIDTRTGVTTVNNRPVPVEVIDSVSYIASYSVETDETSGDETRIPQPQTQEVGFTLQLYPRIMNTNDIMVEYSLSLSELQSLETFGSDESQVQLPEVSSTKFSQQTVLQNGSTLILSGFERNRNSVDRRTGASGGGFLGLGRSKLAETERVTTVVMITPRILKSNRDIGSGKF